MRIIVGLGNPGDQYKNTRHNVGWLALDFWLGNVKWQESKKFSALIHEADDFIFVKPLTFMNDSGQAVQKILNYYKLLAKSTDPSGSDLNDILTVVHDELDLNFGEFKIATASGSAGHRGVESIINYLKTQKFTRLRIGIKNELLKNPIPPEKFVLQPFNDPERERLKSLLKDINIKNLKATT